MERTASVRRQAQTLTLLFFLFSAAGWLWELLFVGATTGRLVNRGVLHGPWLPVYGTGGVLIVLLLGRCRGWRLLVRSALLGGAVEYASSVALERLFHARWWDYSGWAWNLNGRVALGSAAAFALAGWLAVRLAGPALAGLLSRLPDRARTAACRCLGALFALDAAASLLRPNMGEGVSMLL